MTPAQIHEAVAVCAKNQRQRHGLTVEQFLKVCDIPTPNHDYTWARLLKRNPTLSEAALGYELPTLFRLTLAGVCRLEATTKGIAVQETVDAFAERVGVARTLGTIPKVTP